MKKVFVVAGVVLSVVLAVISGIKIYTHHQAARYEETAVPYVKMVVPEISKWDTDSIKNLMSPELMK